MVSVHKILQNPHSSQDSFREVLEAMHHEPAPPTPKSLFPPLEDADATTAVTTDGGSPKAKSSPKKSGFSVQTL